MPELVPRDTPLTVFVGRHTELKQLVAGLDRALGGRGGMFLLSGEPGIGKTRAAEQLDLEARKRGAAVYWGRSSQAEGAPPYWPWVQILRAVLRDLGDPEFGRLAGPGLARILQVVPDLRGHFPDVAPASMDDEQNRFAIYDSVTQLLLDAAATRPIVVVLDDLHWADTPSLLLLQLLAGHLSSSSLMVIGTYRDRELAAGHPLRTHLADFVRRGETSEMPMAGLRDEEAVSLVRALTGFEPERDLIQRLQAQTAGNPFFLCELSRTLGEAGQEPGRWKFSMSADAVPQGIGAVLRRRIEALSPDCRAALEVAAVAGREFDLDLLGAATRKSRSQLLDLCDEAIASGVVSRRGGSYAFTHGLVRDTVYGDIASAGRGELHALIGRLLEEGSLAGSEIPAQLAHHFVEASMVDQSLRSKAFEYSSAAGRRAMAELAYEEAVRLFELALEKTASLDLPQRAELLLALGQARYMAGDVGGALDAAEQVVRLGEKLDDGNLLARAALVVRGVGGPGLSHRIKRLCDAAMRRPIRDKALRVQVLSQLTVALMQTGDAADQRAAREASREAVQLAQDAVDADVIFAGIHARQMATSGPDGVDERLHLADRTLRLAQETGRSSTALWGHAWRLDALVQLGRIDDAEVAVAVLSNLADELREPLAMWRALQTRSSLALTRGRFAESRTLAEKARQLGRKGHHAPAEFTHLAGAYVLAVHVGGVDVAFQALVDHLRPLAEGAASSVVFESGGLALLGRLEETRRLLRKVAGVRLETVGPGVAWLPGMAQLTEAIALVGDKDLAAATYAALLPYARLNISAGGTGMYGSVSRYLGTLAATLGRWDDAAKHYGQAIDFERRMGAPPFLARSRIAYAEMLVKRGRDADLRDARQLLDAALATSRELGMKPWEDRAITLISALGSRGVADHPLSSRELEVAALVAEGLSNREIAGRLHLSERTAESHVKNICDKLGFNSRSQVAAWVAGRQANR